MSINIALSGAKGKMGQAITQLIEQDSDLKLILPITKDHNYNLFKELGTIDLFIDFSTPDSCINYLQICKELKLPVIVGTTGFSVKQMDLITELSKNVPILLAPNMSLGVNICKYLLAALSRLADQFDYSNHIIINEVHHKNKKDAPSGTALLFAELIKANFINKDPTIEFNSKRIGKVNGKHQVVFSSLLEEIQILHQVKDRKVFAEGVVLAAKWLFKQKHASASKLYTFNDLFDLEQILQDLVIK